MSGYILYITATLKNQFTGKKKTVSKMFLTHDIFTTSIEKLCSPSHDLCKLECKRIYYSGEVREGV